MPIVTSRLRRPFSELAVSDAMSGGVIRCTPDTPLVNVARLMADHRVHAIFVFDFGSEDDETVELWGLVSDLDVAAAVCGDIEKRTARDSAVAPLVTITSAAPLEWAARLMVEHDVSHLAVLDPVSNRPVGVVSTLDIARAAAGEP